MEYPDTIDIPLLDDFSKPGFIPDGLWWDDDWAYINTNYPVNPVTIGVATLDAIGPDGSLNGSDDHAFVSEYLTSLPIYLGDPGLNDLYLSFYYQNGGNGDPPEPQDSLCVEFYAPELGEWKSIWSTPGDTAGSDEFTQVLLAIEDAVFLKDGFRFRFKNYVSLTGGQSFPSRKGNVDHWHIDYVYLDAGRSAQDSIMPDVAVVEPGYAILKTYQSIPWSHLPEASTQEFMPEMQFIYRNNDVVPRNVGRRLFFTETTGASGSENAGSINLPAGQQEQYPFFFQYAPDPGPGEDSVAVHIKAYLTTDEEDYKWNDTLRYTQIFSNYYAYDDGSAENGYGLDGSGTINAKVAYRYFTYKPDTLRAIDIYFNQIAEDLDNFFILGIWDHNGASEIPGDLLYSQAVGRPVYQDEINRFTRYRLDTVLVVDENFYIGWIKTREYMFNVGFDTNIDNGDKLFYNLGQEWVNSSFSGSLMLRPVMGSKLITGTREKSYPRELMIYPNPVRDRLHWPSSFMDQVGEARVLIFDMQGRLVMQEQPGQPSLDVSRLEPGVYILRLYSHRLSVGQASFIKL